MTLATIYRDVLELIHVLSYVGVSQTRCAIPDPADRLLPQWHPSDGSDLLTLPDGVPDPLLRACLFSVSAADASRRWGSESLDVDAVLSYLRDRQWVACGRADVPIVAAFRNPLDREEVITTIAVETAEGRTAYIWKTPGGWYVLDRRSGRLISDPYAVYSLTPEGHRLLEEGADPACAEGTTDGARAPASVSTQCQIREPVKRPSGRKRAIWDALTDRQRNSLRALRTLKAFDADSRRDSTQIAPAAEGQGANPDGFKVPLAALVKEKLLDRKHGRGGGYWLTAKAQDLLAEVDPQAPDGDAKQ